VSQRFALVLVLALGACGSSVPAERKATCETFAARVVECAFHSSVRPAMTADEKASVRSIAYAVCTRTTDDEAALHYYGNVDATIACMKGKTDCDEVRVCLTRDQSQDAP
jgi:hypothetical protein